MLIRATPFLSDSPTARDYDVGDFLILDSCFSDSYEPPSVFSGDDVTRGTVQL